jgi:hypothetical protein
MSLFGRPVLLDLLWLFFVELGEFVSGASVCLSNSSSLACSAGVSRCSARWMKRIMSQVTIGGHCVRVEVL